LGNIIPIAACTNLLCHITSVLVQYRFEKGMPESSCVYLITSAVSCCGTVFTYM
jgi:hypothetical protein